MLGLSLAACHRGKDDKTADGTRVAGDTSKQTHRAAVYPEAEALGVLDALNDAVVAIANVARDVSQNDDVLRFAAVLASDHRGLKEIIDAQAAKAGVTPTEGAAASQVQTETDSIVHAFATLPMGFNNTWAEEQIKAHQKAIAVLDTAIVPSVANEQVRNLLQQARPTFVAHLQRAMQILASRRQQAAERGEAWVSGFNNATNPAAPSATAPTPATAPRRDTTTAAPDTTPAPPTSTSNM